MLLGVILFSLRSRLELDLNFVDSIEKHTCECLKADDESECHEGFMIHFLFDLSIDISTITHVMHAVSDKERGHKA